MSGKQHQRARWTAGRALGGGWLLAAVLTLDVGAAHAESHAVHESQWALQTVDLDRVWGLGNGDGVIVAVLDTGVDANHADLLGRVLPGADFGDGSSGDGTHDPGRDHGHGTQVASLIAGTADNYDGDGLRGLAPKATILPFGVYRDAAPEPGAVSRAVRAAVKRRADVMVLPDLGSETHHGLGPAVQHAIDSDVVVVAGVGDDPTADPSQPASIPGVVAVTAVDRGGRVWEKAERGPHVTLAGPGVEILAASADGRYWTGDDTAYAAAWVAGASALVRSANPDWTAGEVIQRLIDTARGRGGPAADGNIGYGIVDPQRAVTDRTRPVAARNPLLSSGRSAAGDGPATEGSVTKEPVNTDASTAIAGGVSLFLAVAAALAGMVLFVAALRVLCRRLRPADHGDRVR